MIVSIALASQVAGWNNRGNIKERAARGSWDQFDRVMDKVRDVPPRLLPRTTPVYGHLAMESITEPAT